MNDPTLKMVLDALDDLRGYSGVGEDGNPYDTPSWNAALVSARQVILDRLNLGERDEQTNSTII